MIVSTLPEKAKHFAYLNGPFTLITWKSVVHFSEVVPL